MKLAASLGSSNIFASRFPLTGVLSCPLTALSSCLASTSSARAAILSALAEPSTPESLSVTLALRCAPVSFAVSSAEAPLACSGAMASLGALRSTSRLSVPDLAFAVSASPSTRIRLFARFTRMLGIFKSLSVSCMPETVPFALKARPAIVNASGVDSIAGAETFRL